MVSKKSTRPPPAPTRRSARLASRSPSVERDILEDSDAHAATPQTIEIQDHSPLERRSAKRRLVSRSPSVEMEIPEESETVAAPEETMEMPHRTPLARRSATRRRLKMLEIQQAVKMISEKEEASAENPRTPAVAPASSPKIQQTSPNQPPAPSPSLPTIPESAAEEPKAGWFQTISKYLSSPFTRKRQAEEPAELAPSSKRSRQEEPNEAFHATQIAHHPEQDSNRKPRPALTPKSTREHAGPPTSHAQVPTSLSTIREHHEPSIASNTSESVLESTPSRPPREQPQNSRLQMPQSTPFRRPVTTPTMRRSAQLRAAARVADSNTPISGFTTRTAVPKPRETNADARLAKLERMRTLQRELEELQQDEDVKEMQSHRLKRVKIDNLVEIPHNKPGDPSGCFRVPEEDSDDEMEVYENVEERSNLFEEVNTAQANDVNMREERNVEGTDTDMVFRFPDVGPVPKGYHVSQAYRDEAGRLFAAGLTEFMAT